MLMDGMLGAKRQRPLTIAGPPGTKERLPEIQEALYPGSRVMEPKFDVDVIDMEVLKQHDVRGLKVMTYPAVHTVATNPTSMRVDVAGKAIAYTGDSAWTEHIPELARDADLFITECYFYEKRVPFHMNYPDLKEHADELRPKRTVLTHMGPEMLAAQERIDEECAYDGMVIEL